MKTNKKVSNSYFAIIESDLMGIYCGERKHFLIFKHPKKVKHTTFRSEKTALDWRYLNSSEPPIIKFVELDPSDKWGKSVLVREKETEIGLW